MAPFSTAADVSGVMELEDRGGRSMAVDNNVNATKEMSTSVGGVSEETDDDVEIQDAAFSGTKSTSGDAADMRRMGKDQQLVRHFRTLSMTSFLALCNPAWEIGLFVFSPALQNGGRPMLVWSLLWNFLMFGPIYFSLAEMASMAPIAGAQYHWVSEFAPAEYQRILSYVTGWTSTIAWQAGNAQGIFIVGSLIQTIILINDENYGFPSWQGALLAIGSMGVAYGAVVYGSKALPYWQNPAMAIHILGFFAYLVPIWVNAPTASHREVWLTFENYGGWSSLGLAALVGQLTGITAFAGLDASVHMSEEVRDARRSVPRTMITVWIINFAILFVAAITVCYHITNTEDALNDPTTYPAIYVLRQALPLSWITVILVIIIVLNVASNIVYLAAVTRDLFAFARDRGLPFSNWLSVVNTKRQIPQNAAMTSCVFAILLAMIYIGSPVAFYAMTSLAVTALLQCYGLSIGCHLWRRINHPETLPPAHFPLGRWGVPCNIIAIIYCAYGFFWSFWPTSTPVTAEGFNWSSVIFVSIIGIAMVYFIFRAKRTYVGPVAAVEGRRAG